MKSAAILALVLLAVGCQGRVLHETAPRITVGAHNYQENSIAGLQASGHQPTATFVARDVPFVVPSLTPPGAKGKNEAAVDQLNDVKADLKINGIKVTGEYNPFDIDVTVGSLNEQINNLEFQQVKLGPKLIDLDTPDTPRMPYTYAG